MTDLFTADPTTPAAQPRFQCRHILTDGHRCGSPCLRHEEFCYYHSQNRKPIARAELSDRRAHTAEFDLPLPEDRSAIQLSIGEVLRRIATNAIDPKRAGLLLYGLQIASLNLPRTAVPADPTQTVDEITDDPIHGPLAPIAELGAANKKKSLEQILQEQWAREAQLPQDEEAVAAEAARDAKIMQSLDKLRNLGNYYDDVPETPAQAPAQAPFEAPAEAPAEPLAEAPAQPITLPTLNASIDPEPTPSDATSIPPRKRICRQSLVKWQTDPHQEKYPHQGVNDEGWFNRLHGCCLSVEHHRFRPTGLPQHLDASARQASGRNRLARPHLHLQGRDAREPR